MQRLIVIFLALATGLLAQDQKVYPTWLYRNLSALREYRIDVSSGSCHYTPIFGQGDVESRLPQTIARFGVLTLDPHGACQTVEYSRQEELYFVREGNGMVDYGGESHPVVPDDFTYLAPSVRHRLSNPSSQTLRVVVTTVRISPGTPISQAAPFAAANLSELQEQTVQGHPKSVLYKLLIGPRTATRDRINAAYAVTDFFLMDFAPAGTNFPHHHEVAEEIYLVLDGEGQMVAGGGLDGVEGLQPAKSGDAYYFRPNCTVGFYNQTKPALKAHILAVRAFVPMPQNQE